MNKQHMYAFLDRLMKLTDNTVVGGVPLYYAYLEEFRELKRIVSYYYSVCKDSV